MDLKKVSNEMPVLTRTNKVGVFFLFGKTNKHKHSLLQRALSYPSNGQIIQNQSRERKNLKANVEFPLEKSPLKQL